VTIRKLPKGLSFDGRKDKFIVRLRRRCSLCGKFFAVNERSQKSCKYCTSILNDLAISKGELNEYQKRKLSYRTSKS